MLIRHQDQEREPAYSQAQDIEPAASPPLSPEGLQAGRQIVFIQSPGWCPWDYPRSSP